MRHTCDRGAPVVGPAYWAGVLAVALDQYDALVSKGAQRGQNKDANISGQEIADRHADGSLVFTWMGRDGGEHGHALASDIDADHWRTRVYEVRYEPLPANRNWFPIESFVARVVG